MKNYNSLIVEDCGNKKSFLRAEKWINQHKIVKCDDEWWEPQSLSWKYILAMRDGEIKPEMFTLYTDSLRTINLMLKIK